MPSALGYDDEQEHAEHDEGHDLNEREEDDGAGERVLEVAVAELAGMLGVLARAEERPEVLPAVVAEPRAATGIGAATALAHCNCSG